jgi:hypothetical protein
VLLAGMGLGSLLLTIRSAASPMTHVGMLGDSIFDNSAYIGTAPDVRAQVQSILPTFQVSSEARDGAVIADIQAQLSRLPRSATQIVVSIGGNDALMASGVLDENARTVSDALHKLAAIRDSFADNYTGMLKLLGERAVPTATCTIYEPRFPEPGRRRAAATALTILNDVITRKTIEAGFSLIDLRVICDQDEDFANPIEPSAIGGAKIARAIGLFATQGRATAAVFGKV